MTAKLVIPLADISKEDDHLVGPKALDLAQAHPLVSVPPGFVVTTAAFENFTRETGIKDKFKKLLDQASSVDPDSLTRVSAQIQALIQGTKVPSEIAYAIFTAYHDLKHQQTGLRKVLQALRQTDPAVAIRSGQEVSKTGIESVSGEANLLVGVQRYWAWHFSPQKVHHADLPTVIVQSLLGIEVTAFVTAKKIEKQISQATVSAVWGNGALFKLGKIGADLYEVDLSKESIIFESPSPQEIKQIHVPNIGPEIVQIPARQGKARKLSNSQVLHLGKLASKLNTHFYFPHSYEFALSGDSFFLMSMHRQDEPIEELKAISKETPKTKLEKQARPAANWQPLLKATPVTKGLHAGHVKVLSNSRQLHRVYPGDIIVVKSLSKDYLPALRKAGALVTEQTVQHDSIHQFVKDKGLPHVANAQHATSLLKDNQIIIVHGGEGKLYTFS